MKNQTNATQEALNLQPQPLVPAKKTRNKVHGHLERAIINFDPKMLEMFTAILNGLKTYEMKGYQNFFSIVQNPKTLAFNSSFHDAKHSYHLELKAERREV